MGATSWSGEWRQESVVGQQGCVRGGHGVAVWEANCVAGGDGLLVDTRSVRSYEVFRATGVGDAIRGIGGGN